MCAAFPEYTYITWIGLKKLNPKAGVRTAAHKHSPKAEADFNKLFMQAGDWKLVLVKQVQMQGRDQADSGEERGTVRLLWVRRVWFRRFGEAKKASPR